MLRGLPIPAATAGVCEMVFWVNNWKLTRSLHVAVTLEWDPEGEGLFLRVAALKAKVEKLTS